MKNVTAFGYDTIYGYNKHVVSIVRTLKYNSNILQKPVCIDIKSSRAVAAPENKHSDRVELFFPLAAASGLLYKFSLLLCAFHTAEIIVVHTSGGGLWFYHEGREGGGKKNDRKIKRFIFFLQNNKVCTKKSNCHHLQTDKLPN